MRTQPVLFIGHGSPMNAIEKSNFTEALNAWGMRLIKNPPKVLLCVSAHWFVDRFIVTNNEDSNIMYDFFGFGDKLNKFKYMYKGSKKWSKRIQEIYDQGEISTDDARGIDHGVWSVLAHLFPKAQIPVVQLSMNKKLSLEEHVNFYSNLHILRDEGALILGSGNIVHSFAGIREEIEANPYDWALEFDEKVKASILNNSISDLIHYENFGHCAKLAVPTVEHYLPLLFAMSLKRESDKIKFVFEGFQYSTLSMRCFELS
ncbi:dioxygenase family protein [Fluviispira multicolorata]|uniref:dioxygenase family protein n=1 Tax=Fluviispira multicolorata TaxID=2654512 RepID=UPI0013758481|nr:class III extradiol ring-cleavage dioxygenase [Fluviispira multicolorata]